MQTFRAMISGVVPDDTQFLLRRHVEAAAEAMKQEQARVNDIRVDLQPLELQPVLVDVSTVTFDSRGVASGKLELVDGQTVRIVKSTDVAPVRSDDQGGSSGGSPEVLEPAAG